MVSHTLGKRSNAHRDLWSADHHDQPQRLGCTSSQAGSLCQETSAILSTDSLQRLSVTDRARFVLYGVGAHYTPRFTCVHHAFSEHVRMWPAATAVEHGRERISYQELDRCSDELARKLRSRGVCPGQRVCLLVQRSIAMVVAILAVLKAGASYMPLDGGIVTDRSLEYILGDSGAKFVLCLPAFLHRVPPHLEIISLENCLDAKDGYVFPLLDCSVGENELYVIYTSGTTGQPKGVSISHQNVMNLLSTYPGNVGMRPGARVSQLLNVAFDMCAWEVLGSLVNGCTLCVRGKSSEEWETVLRSVDVVISTPTILQSHPAEDYPNVRFVATAGEPCPKALADSWSRTATFFNSCGPTETTIVNTMEAHQTGGAISIGRPTPNNRVYILDFDRNPVPIGQVGIMWAAGRGISSGYVNRPELTQERFVLDPFAKDGSVMFNTGDLGRWTKDGQLQHYGRVDDQVKIKGFRVELDGVAAALQSHPGVTQAVALLVDSVLWGVFCPANLDIAAVRRATAELMPYYAVPTRFLPLDKLPRTVNGKVNKALLVEVIRQIAAHEATVSVSPGEPPSEGLVPFAPQTGGRSRFKSALPSCVGMPNWVLA